MVTFETLLPHGKQTLAPTFSHTSVQYYVPAKVLEFHPYTPDTMGQSDNRCHYLPVLLLEIMQCGTKSNGLWRPQTWNPILLLMLNLGLLVQFRCSVVSDSLWPREPQHARPPCPSPIHHHLVHPRVYPNSCPHPAISSSVVPFSSCPQSLPASESFPMSQLFAWGGQSTGVSASISPSNEHPGLISLRMDWLDLLAVQRTLKSLLQHRSSKASILRCSAFFPVQLSHPYMTTGKNHSLD